MLIAEIIIVLLIFLIIVTQRVGVRITKNEVTSVYVNFIFTAIRIGNGKKSKVKLTKIFKNRFFIKSTIEYLLPKTDVAIYSLELDNDPSLPEAIANSILFGTALTYIKRSAKSVAYTPNGKGDVDIELSFVLYHAIISLILGQYYKTKNKI